MVLSHSNGIPAIDSARDYATRRLRRTRLSLSREDKKPKRLIFLLRVAVMIDDAFIVLPARIHLNVNSQRPRWPELYAE